MLGLPGGSGREHACSQAKLRNCVKPGHDRIGETCMGSALGFILAPLATSVDSPAANTRCTVDEVGGGAGGAGGGAPADEAVRITCRHLHGAEVVDVLQHVHRLLLGGPLHRPARPVSRARLQASGSTGRPPPQTCLRRLAMAGTGEFCLESHSHSLFQSDRWSHNTACRTERLHVLGLLEFGGCQSIQVAIHHCTSSYGWMTGWGGGAGGGAEHLVLACLHQQLHVPRQVRGFGRVYHGAFRHVHPKLGGFILPSPTGLSRSFLHGGIGQGPSFSTKQTCAAAWQQASQ